MRTSRRTRSLVRSSASALRLDVRAAEDFVLEAPVEPEAAVRVRLARSQAIHALARMKDGQILEARRDVTVAASGCGM